MIEFTCPHCNQHLQIPDKFEGQKGKCKKCGKGITAPGGEECSDDDVAFGEFAEELLASEINATRAATDLESLTIDVDKRPPPPVIVMPDNARSVGPNVMQVAQGLSQIGKAMLACGCLLPISGCGMLMLIGLFAPMPSSSSGVPAPVYSLPQPASPAPVSLGSNRQPQSAQEAEIQMRQFAAREYPNDGDMQRYIYNQQVSAYRYIGTVKDGEVLGIATREYPGDYSMQKYVYDQQLSAKRYMSSVRDTEVNQIALHEYPGDYSMQKYIYDRQLSAKQYMNSQGNSPAKSAAQRQYPYDYSMQKYTYDRSLRR